MYVDLWLKYKSYFIIANNVGITMYNCAWTVLNLTVDGFNVYTTIPEICKRVHAIYVIYTVCTSLIVESSPGRTMHYTIYGSCGLVWSSNIRQYVCNDKPPLN